MKSNVSSIMSLINKIGPYGLAAGIQAGASFIILPILILLIGPNSYGRYALLEPLVAMSAQFLLLGAHQGMIHAVCKEGKPARKILISFIIKSHLFTLPALLVVYLVTASLLGSRILSALFVTALYLESINLLCLTSVRALGLSWPYFFSVASRYLVFFAAVSMALAIYGRNKLNDIDAMLFLLLSVVSALLALLFFLTLRTKKDDTGSAPTVHGSDYLTAVKYGLPLVLSGLCQSIMSIADRYILAFFLLPAEISAYVVASKYANAMNLVATPVNLWWPTARFQHLHDDDGGESFFSKSLSSLSALYFLVAASLIALSPYLLKLIGPGVDANPVIASILIVVSFCYSIQVILNVGLLSAGHTMKNTIAAGVTAVIYMIACLSSVPFGGAYGAAGSGLLSALVFCVFTYRMSQAVMPIKQNIKLVAVCVIALILILNGVAVWL